MCWTLGAALPRGRRCRRRGTTGAGPGPAAATKPAVHVFQCPPRTAALCRLFIRPLPHGRAACRDVISISGRIRHDRPPRWLDRATERRRHRSSVWWKFKIFGFPTGPAGPDAGPTQQKNPATVGGASSAGRFLVLGADAHSHGMFGKSIIFGVPMEIPRRGARARKPVPG